MLKLLSFIETLQHWLSNDRITRSVHGNSLKSKVTYFGSYFDYGLLQKWPPMIGLKLRVLLNMQNCQRFNLPSFLRSRGFWYFQFYGLFLHFGFSSCLFIQSSGFGLPIQRETIRHFLTIWIPDTSGIQIHTLPVNVCHLKAKLGCFSNPQTVFSGLLRWTHLGVKLNLFKIQYS